MTKSLGEIGFSVPYDIAVARPLRRTTRAEREAALEKACYNTEMIPPEMVYIDLQSDSGIGAPSIAQAASLMGGGSAPGDASDAAGRFRDVTGFPFVLPC